MLLITERYQRRLGACNALDPNSIPADKWEKNVFTWPGVDEGKFFSLILETKQLRLNTSGGTKKRKHIAAAMKVDLSDVCIFAAYLTSTTRFLLRY